MVVIPALGSLIDSRILYAELASETEFVIFEKKDQATSDNPQDLYLVTVRSPCVLYVLSRAFLTPLGRVGEEKSLQMMSFFL